MGLLYLPVIVYVGLGLSLVKQAVAYEGLRPTQAIRRSWDLVAGQRWMLFLYLIVLGLFTLLGVCLCCVGYLLLTGPLTLIAQHESYLALTRGAERPSWWIETRNVIQPGAGSWGPGAPPAPPRPAPPAPPAA